MGLSLFGEADVWTVNYRMVSEKIKCVGSARGAGVGSTPRLGDL